MIDVYIEDDTVHVKAPSRLADIISRIPSMRVDGDEWVAPLSPAVMLAVAKDLSHQAGFRPDPTATDYMRRVRAMGRRVEDIKHSGPDHEYDERLYGYQRAGVWMLSKGGCLLGDEMGTGKTVMALTAARQVGAQAVLVIAPNSMKHRWLREAETWYPEAARIVVHGTKKQKLEAITQAKIALDGGCPIIVALNWESLQKRVGLTKLIQYGSLPVGEEGPLNEIEWDCVIADEAHRAKGPKTDQSRGLAYLGQDAKYRWALTGTPVLNTPGDLWAIGRFYEPTSYGPARHRWHSRYVASIETRWGPKDLGLDKYREPEFTKWFDLSFIRRTKDEVLDLPPVIGGLNSDDGPEIREVEMTSKQRTAYNKMVKDMIAAIDEGILVATDPLALLTRLSQIASATPVVNEDGDVVALDTPSNKVAALFEVLEEMDEERQLVVFAASRKLIELTASELTRKGVSSVQITGAVDPALRDGNVQRFQNGDVRVALCTLGAGSEGINLYAADTAVFLQRSYSFGQSLQAEARIHRVGQTADRVHIIDLVSTGTVDEAVLDALYSKGEMSQEVLRDSARQLLRSKN